MQTRFNMHARIPLPDPQLLSPAGRKVYDSILASRGNLDGPFLAWLHSPGLADPAEKLGAFCRYDTKLLPIESELLILLVAARYRCTGEWQIHQPIAERSGLDAALIEDIRVGRPPRLQEPRLVALHLFAAELLSNNHVSDWVYDDAIRYFGRQGVVELVGILGYYALVAMTLNAFEMKLKREDSPDPFPSQA